MAQVEIEVVAKDSFSSTLGNFGSIMTGIESAINLAGQAFQTFAGFAMQGLDAIASYERMAASLETLVAKEILATGAASDMASALAMSGDRAEELLKWNQELAIKSPFTAEGVNNALRMAMAYGFTVDEAKRLTEALIDFAAGSGATEYAMEAIARALGQISATGKVTGGDMLQLVNAGLPVVEILAEGFGVTTAELMKMREQGLLPATEAIEYITQYLETNFAGAAERQANTWAGLQGTFEDIKNMGLREFFGSMFEVLQPLAVQLSTWLQGEGMEKLREWGAMLGEFTASLVEQIPQIVGYIEELKAAFDTGGFMAAVDIVLPDLGELVVDLDAKLAEAINRGVESGAFRESGDAFGNLIVSLLDSGLEVGDAKAPPAIGQAIAEWFRGAIGEVYFQRPAQDIAAAFVTVFLDSVRQNFLTSVQWSKDIAANFVTSFIDAVKANFAASVGWVSDTFTRYVIDPVKRILGIASPSTVFAGIGRDIVLGLLAGWGSTIGSFLSVVQSFIDRVLGLFAPVLDILGIDLGGTTSTGTVGGRSPGTTDPRDGGPILTGSGIVNNFYGPVYVGSMQELYDCPSPHPLMTASSQSLLTSTISP